MRGARSSPTTGEAGPRPLIRIPGSATPTGRGSAERHTTCLFSDPSRTPRRSRGWTDAGPSLRRFLTTPVSIPSEPASRWVELNLLGAIYGSHAALPHFFDQEGRGVIVNVSSIFGRVPMPWAASYSASKAGLAGFTEALRFELASRSGIEVCGVYPAYVDTPTYLNSANYTGRALRPVPPVVPPERVAEQIVGLALRPRRSVRAGALHASAVPYALAPDLTGRLAARLGGRFLFRSGPPMDTSDGGLFETVTGRAEVRGGWGLPERRRARRAVAIAGALAVGTSAVLLSRTRQAERLARALRR
jgi:NAD(P)-dependent dehydrogenase (short-subunit alcohol dehydrogenase family)